MLPSPCLIPFVPGARNLRSGAPQSQARALQSRAREFCRPSSRVPQSKLGSSALPAREPRAP
eukprot:15464325-Alexandrium_andersonii.AAC.1